VKFKTTLQKDDLLNLRYALSLHGEEFSNFYDGLDDYEQKYLLALLETHRFDILDYAFDLDYKGPSFEVLELINRCK
jgi:hypothetical protein